MSNLRERMMNKTAGLRSAKDIAVAEEPSKPAAPRTAPGMAGALASAQRRIVELESSGAATEIPVTDIVPNPWQPRRLFNDNKLSELAASIRETGLIQPIVVRRTEMQYQIVAGERRWRAHQMLAKTLIKVVQVDISDEEMAMLALVENVVRDDLSDYEVARAVHASEKEFPSKKRMAEAMGMARGELYRYLSFIDLPDFIIADLDIHPRLMGATAAQDVVSVLRSGEQSALQLAKKLWADVVAGELDQTKLAAAIKRALSDEGKTRAVSDRSIEKIFAGKNQAGSITRDSSGFTVKIKPGMLTVENEEEIRKLISMLFSSEK